MRKSVILVVDDEKDITEIVTYNLQKEGFEVHSCGDGETALSKCRTVLPDLVVLDVMLPGMDGVEVCRAIRRDERTASIPVVLLTAKGEESDVVLGLGVGADDYVPKPFSVKELVARIRALLRRRHRETEEDDRTVIRVGEILVDSVRHEVVAGKKSITLTLTEFKLLRFLASHTGRVFTRSELLDRVIGEDVYVVDRNIDVHVRSIRKKLGKFAAHIVTVRGVGYKFDDRAVAV
jgi:two-component system phosphate regulon response regulator PhoB